MREVVFLAALLLAIPVLGQQETGPADNLWPLYREGRFEEVIEQGKALLNTGTETAQIQLAVGRSLVDLDRPEEAQPYLMRAIKLDPDRTWVYAWGQVYLGFSHFKLGRLDMARAALIAGRDCQATRNATLTAQNNLRILGLDESFDDWTSFETPHFSFRFSPRLAVFDRAGYARVREEAFDSISQWCGGQPEGKVRFFVWAGPEEAALAGMPTLGFARPREMLIHSLFNQTVGHEMTHIISFHALQPAVQTGLINEGLAITLDQTGRDTMSRARAAVAAGRGGTGETPFLQVGLRALWEDFELLADEYTYPIAGAWVDYLLARGGKDRFVQFFTDQTLEHARQIYGPELEGWIDAFESRLYGEG
jgi:tetratricopeptide (TPR) repeat protein